MLKIRGGHYAEIRVGRQRFRILEHRASQIIGSVVALRSNS